MRSIRVFETQAPEQRPACDVVRQGLTRADSRRAFALLCGPDSSHIRPMAKNPDHPKKPGKPPKSKAPNSKASRPDVQPIGPALAELLNPAINRGDAGLGSGTGLQPPPDNSWDRRSGGEAAAHRARASTRGTSEDVAKRDASLTSSISRGSPPPNPPPQAGEGSRRLAPHADGKDFPAESQPASPLPLAGEGQGGGASTRQGFDEAPQANYGTAATIPALDPELAKQFGFTTEEEDAAALARPPRNKMEALGVAATADALESLIRDGRPEFKGDDGQVKIWTPHRPPRPEKSEGGVRFVIKSEYEPKGDQPTAIAELVEGITRNDRTQVLLGVTGSGKTYTMAKVIEATQRPAIILAPNKTLAAQLYGEFKSFFPDNAVEYFVSYYDYYQPEAYVPRTDTYIEKDSSINEQIDRMRHSATRALMERDDVIIVASVSCIYGIGPLENYQSMTFRLHKGQKVDRSTLLRRFVEQQYKRNDNAFQRGTFRVRGDTIDLFPAHYEDKAWRIEMFGDEIESITEFDPLTGDKTISLGDIIVYANSHYVTPKPTMQKAIDQIKTDLKQRLDEFNRKSVLAEFGFRLPSAIDNRPLKFEEWETLRPQTTFVSATPGPWEMERTQGIFIEQVIRPTGLIDPTVIIRPVEKQVDDLIAECRDCAKKAERVLVTVLTKRMAEDLVEYMHEAGIRCRYLHSDIDTLERIEIIRDLRLGAFDVLVGINLLREGLDIPECALVAILDADKEGFLRSETSLIQTIGRAARNIEGRVVLYADHVTGSMRRAIAETDRRRSRQESYNTEHGITPESIKRSIQDIMSSVYERDHVLIATGAGSGGEFADAATIGHNFEAVIGDLETRMREAAADLDFEEAARLRDEIKRLRATELAVSDDPTAKRPDTSGAAASSRGGRGLSARAPSPSPRAPPRSERVAAR